MNTQLKGFLALLLCAIIFGSFSVFARWLNIDLQSYQQILFRNGFGLLAAVLVLIVFKRNVLKDVRSSLQSAPRKYLLAYTLTFPIAVICFTLSVLQTKVITTIFGLYVGSLLISLLVGVFIFKEKLTPTKLVCLALVAIGLLVFVYPFTVETLGIGLLLGILAGVFDGAANSFRKYLAGKLDRIILVNLQMIGGILIAIPLVFIFQQTQFNVISLNTWVVGIIWGIGLVAISYLTLIGFQNFDLNLGTVVLSSEIFFASLFAFLAFGEISSIYELIGGVVIVAASTIANTTFMDKWFNKSKLSINS